MSRAGATAATLTALGALALTGCGSQNGASVVAAGGEPSPRGTMTIAVPDRPHDLDPMSATSPVDRLVSRQLFEPLVERLTGPYDDVRHLPGLAVAVRPAAGRTLWRIRLRSRVRFQDGSPLDASAVVANAERWLISPTGRALLPGLVAADAPRPNLVRLIGDRPMSGVRRALASARLAIVSPREFSDRSGRAARITQISGAGSGPFELRPPAGGNLVLARNTSWWGTAHGLGPALDQVELRVVPGMSGRLRLLRRGEVEAAWGLDGSAATRLRRDPLLTSLIAPDQGSVGLERSVRGIDSATEIPLLSGVWLTTIAAG
jgi:peptide/nickel transport system substrate-binding protein